MAKSAPNIIYIFSDQHRYDAMGCAGNPVIQTPNLDRMANEGVRFSRAYCQSPVCQPSRASVISGLYTHQHGISRNFTKDLDPDADNMMKQLKGCGYTTAQIGKTHFYSPDMQKIMSQPEPREVDLRQFASKVQAFGFDFVLEEFDRYWHAPEGIAVQTPYTEYLRSKGRLEAYQEQIRSVWRLTPSHWEARTSVLPQEDDLTAFLAREAIGWLKTRNRQTPFFLMLDFVQPHVPLIDDPVWAAFYENAAIPMGPRQAPQKTNEIWDQYLESCAEHSNAHLLTDDYVTNAARHYYGMVSLIDQYIGDILNVLEESGLAEDTWVVYSADHGEMLGDHNLMAKMQFYRSSVQVPAIIRPPAGVSADLPHAPKVYNGLVESIDLTATILDMAGAGPLPDSGGMSLLPVLSGGSINREAAFSAIQGRKSYFVMAATERYRMTIERNSNTYCELFDLMDDPDELHNLVNDPDYAAICRDIDKDLIQPHLAA